MKANDFVSLLSETAPDMARVVNCGLTHEEAVNFLAVYQCKRRDKPLPIVSRSNPLLELLAGWDLSSVEIGMVRFPNPPIRKSLRTIVGCVEVDPLVLLSDVGELVVHEYGTTDHLLWRVAKHGDNFLDALLFAASFLTKRSVGDIDTDESVATKAAAAKCASLAGGEQYLNFYRMLLGDFSA